MVNQALPVGVDDFEKLRKENYYYIDKTGLIVDLLKKKGEVNLFTRPRRFGKTLNMSMLKCFFEIGGDKSIFDGLEITKHKEICDAYMGQYPVVFVSLKSVDGATFEEAYDMLCSVIQQEALRLRYLIDSEKLSDDDLRALKSIIAGSKEPTLIKTSLKTFCSLLEMHYNQKTILLIDEYDVPLEKANLNGYYKQMINIIRTMFNESLKTNVSLYFAALTGCLRVSRESIFTGTNNFKINSIADTKYDEYFGFTEEEVCRMMTDYGIEQHLPEAREWYDGYLFGKQNVYCPWDVINYCDNLIDNPDAEPEAYWMNTSGNDLVRKLLEKANVGTVRMEIERLIAGETISKKLNMQLTHSEVDDSIENVWTLLYVTGYLTTTQCPTGGNYILRIPNKEVRQIYIQQVMTWLNEKVRKQSDKLTELFKAFENGDAETITEYLNEQLASTVSYFDAQESFYHGFLLALLGTCAGWHVSSNVETGVGRADIIVERENETLGFVIEVKEVKNMDQLDDACETAMKQIEEKDYTAVLKLYGVKKILTYGIAFCRKRCKVVAKKVE